MKPGDGYGADFNDVLIATRHAYDELTERFRIVADEVLDGDDAEVDDDQLAKARAAYAELAVAGHDVVDA